MKDDKKMSRRDFLRSAGKVSLGAVAMNVMGSSANKQGTMNLSKQAGNDKEFVSVKTSLSDVERESIKIGNEKVTGNTVYSFTDHGYYRVDNDANINGDFVDSDGFIGVKIPCAAGDIFHVNIFGGSGASRAWGFYDSNNVLLSYSKSYCNLEDKIAAPEGSAYCIFNSSLSLLPTGYYVYKGDTSLIEKVNTKQDQLTFDDHPTASSNNPVTSGGVYEAINEMLEFTVEKKETPVTYTYQKQSFWKLTNADSIATLETYTNTYAVDKIAVLPGEKYRLHVRAHTSKKTGPYAIVDENNAILEKVIGGGDWYDGVITIPPTGAYLLITFATKETPSVWKITVTNLLDAVKKEVRKLQTAGSFDYHGAQVAIIGDSISTNGNWSANNPLGNVPEIVIQNEDVGVELSAYATCYDVGTVVGGYEITQADVGTEIVFIPNAEDVGKAVGKPKNNNSASVVTWWEVAKETLEFNPIPVCWSGSSITSHKENDLEDGNYIYKCSYAWHPSQIRKCGIRIPGTMNRAAPDMVIVYRGTNDLTKSPYARITDYMDSFPTAYPETDTYDDGGTTKYDYAKGMRLLIKKLRDAYPAVRIVLCTLNYFRRMSTTSKFTNNKTDNWNKYNAMIRRIADYEGCDLIEFDKDGITWSNAADGYYQEGTSETAKWTHPNTKGHKVMGNRALCDLQKINNMT